MFARHVRAIPLAAFLLFVLAGTVMAGGWATIKIDAGATMKAVAGRPLTVGFTILQHGVTPAGWVHATVTVTDPATGEHHDATPIASGPDGHFTATITVPKAGFWTWQVALHELLVESPPVTLEVASATGAPPAFDPATAMTAIEQAKNDVVAQLNSEYGPRIDRLDGALTDMTARADSLDSRLASVTRERDALAARIAALEASPSAGSASIPPLGVALLAVLAGGVAGFAMAWLAGLPRPRVRFSPNPREVDPA